jgi:hypothetical protein
MLKKLALRLVAAGVLFVCIGCESSNETGCNTCGTCTAPCTPRNEGAVATRDRLMGKTSLTGEEKLALGDALVDLGQFNAAETAYFGALSRGGLTPEETFHAHMGLAKCAAVQNQNYSARARYAEAWKVASNAGDKDRALIRLAAVEIEDGDLAAARKHRHEILGSYDEVAELDRRLGGQRTAAVRGGATADLRRPSGRGVAPPKINGRETWSARPISMRGEPEPMGRVTRITFHHTADARACGTSMAAVADRMRSYQADHQNSRHWADIGYHFVIDPAGRIWEGRQLTWKGAHAGNKQANENNVGIALIGNFQDCQPGAAQRAAAEELASWLALEYGVPSSRIYGHCDIEKLYCLKGTCCPGRNFGPTMTGVKRAVDRAQTRGSVARGE